MDNSATVGHEAARAFICVAASAIGVREQGELDRGNYTITRMHGLIQQAERRNCGVYRVDRNAESPTRDDVLEPTSGDLAHGELCRTKGHCWVYIHLHAQGIPAPPRRHPRLRPHRSVCALRCMPQGAECGAICDL